MYIVTVLVSGQFVEHELAGKYARKERAEGAMEFATRMGEDRPMRIELVNPGLQGNKGRTEHGAALATANGKVTDPKRLAQLRESIANARAVRAAKRVLREEVSVKKDDPRAEPSEMTMTEEQVAALIGSIRPGKGSGEYVLEIAKLRPLAKVGT